MNKVIFEGQEIKCHPRANIVTGKNNVGKTYFLDNVFSNALGQNQFLDGLDVRADVPYSEIFKDNEIKLKVIEILKEINSDVVDFERTPDFCSIEYSDGTYEDLWCSGNALVSIIRILSRLPLAKNRVYIIDEFAPSVQEYVLRPVIKLLMELAERYNVQLFISTNRLEVIDSMLQTPNELNIIRIRKHGRKYYTKIIEGSEALKLRQDYRMDTRQ